MKYLKNAAIAAVAFTLAVGLSFSGAEAARIKTSVAGAAPGAAAYVIWGGLAALVSKESKTVEMSNLTTRGAVEDIRLVENGKAEFALGVATLVDLALKGKKMFKKPYKNVCGFGPGTVSQFHIAVRKDSGIKTVADLNGKRMSFARRGSSTHFMTRTIVGLAGIKVREENLNWNVAADAIKDGRLDAFTIPNPVPSPAVLKLATSLPITLVPVDGKVGDGLLKSNAAYFKTTIVKNAYNGVDKPVPTIGYAAWTIVGCNVPADVVYEVARINFSKKGREFLLKVHKGWASGFVTAPDLKGMAAINLKVHPGAARYWKEVGNKLPMK